VREGGNGKGRIRNENGIIENGGRTWVAGSNPLGAMCAFFISVRRGLYWGIEMGIGFAGRGIEKAEQ
jgi:hypothetical protein